MVVGKAANGHGYVLADYSMKGSPHEWATVAVHAYHEWQADRLVGEKNYGGDMVEHTLRTAEGGLTVSYKNAQATRGKAIRAEPVAAMYEKGQFHHVGAFPHLENEMTNWQPGDPKSPNRLDSLVWCGTELFLNEKEARAW